MSQPLGQTLSQIIRQAANENARKNIIDLTFDNSDAESVKEPAPPAGSESRPPLPPLPRTTGKLDIFVLSGPHSNHSSSIRSCNSIGT